VPGLKIAGSISCRQEPISLVSLRLNYDYRKIGRKRE